MNLFDRRPWASPDVFVAPNATVVGSVSIDVSSAVLYGAVVRGDQGKVEIGAYTTINDRAVVYTSDHHGEDSEVKIGDYVVVGTCVCMRLVAASGGASCPAPPPFTHHLQHHIQWEGIPLHCRWGRCCLGVAAAVFAPV